MRFYQLFLHFIGFQDDGVSHGERLVSALGGFIGICTVGIISGWWLADSAVLLILASMGSSAVLLFAVPHGKLSQPWALVGGHVISALAGVAMARNVPDPVLAAALAVGLAIALMHYARCIHPPGGATALTAVVGGHSIHSLGYQFVLTPVLINTLAILVAAILFNGLFTWRRYPAVLGGADRAPASSSPAPAAIAVNRSNPATPDSTPAATTEMATPDPDEIAEGRCYSNGGSDDPWSVRKVIVIEKRGRTGEDMVTYRVVAGSNRDAIGEISRSDFARWARCHLERSPDSLRLCSVPCR